MRPLEHAYLNKGWNLEGTEHKSSPDGSDEVLVESDFIGQLAAHLSTSRPRAQETLRNWMIDAHELRKTLCPTVLRAERERALADHPPCLSRGPPTNSSESSDHDLGSKVQ